MANEQQIGAICLQYEYSTVVSGQGEPVGPELSSDHIFNISGGPLFSTIISIRRDGTELRNINWVEAKHDFTLDISALNHSEINSIRDLYHTSLGQYGSFRLRNYIDDTLTDEPIGYGDGVIQEFQIIKTYSGGGRSIGRDIKRIVGGTVIVKQCQNGDGTDVVLEENDDYAIDYETGRITFVIAPEDGTCIRVSCKFEMRCRFDAEQLDAILNAHGTSGLGSIDIVEVRG